LLFPRLQKQGEMVVPLLQAELDCELKPTWSDGPAAWPPPPADLVRKLEAAYGLVEEHFGFGQTLPLADVAALAEDLRPAGYRLARLRPYPHADQVRAAALWTRDGQEAHLAHGLRAADLTRRDADEQRMGYQPVDVACYPDVEGGEQFAAAWTRTPAGSSTKLEVGRDPAQLTAREAALHQDGYRRLTAAFWTGQDGPTHWAALWHKAAGQSAPGVNSKADESFLGTEPDYSGDNHLGDLQVDVQLGWAGPVLSSRERVTRQLQQAEALLRNQPGNRNARLQRAIARFYRGADAQALEDLNGLIAKAPKVADAYQYRALVRARLGQAAEARADLAQYQRLSTRESAKIYLDAVESAWLGDEAGLARLEETLAKAERPGEYH
jgi:hypothetical protein